MKREVVETGVMIIKNGKAWGVEHKDDYGTSYGWVKIQDGEIHDPRYCLKPTDTLSRDSHYRNEMIGAKLYPVEKRTVFTLPHLNEKQP